MQRMGIQTSARLQGREIANQLRRGEWKCGKIDYCDEIEQRTMLSLSSCCAISTSPQSTRDEDFRTLDFTPSFAFAPNLRPLRRGALRAESSHWRCATSARPPPPPPPNFGGDDTSGYISRLQEEISKIQDRVRIFFAVLFWMSLFFWASVWDGTDDSRNNKGPRFRKKFK